MLKALKNSGEFLGSLRLAIVLLIAISVVSVFGVIIPQGLPEEHYVHQWGSSAGRVILSIGMDHVFSALWFYVLLGLLACNIIVCSSSRFWKNVLNPVMKNETPAKTLSGHLKDIGSFVFHISIVILLVGGLVGTRFGYSVVKQLSTGQVTEVRDRPFLLRCDWFKIVRNGDGAIKEYLSGLAVLAPDSSVLLEKIIGVNNPLIYKGIRFYQSSYGQDPRRAADIALRILGPDLPGGVFNVIVPYDSVFSLPETDLTVRASQFIPDFVIDMQTGVASSRSDEPKNPAVRVMVFRGKDTLYNHWAFFRYPQMHSGTGEYKVIATSYTPSYFTGIQIRRNPGEPVVWFGIVCMTLGILAVFNNAGSFKTGRKT
jgi:cytochrome c biogenesis protein